MKHNEIKETTIMSGDCVDKVCSLVQECSGVCNIIGTITDDIRKKLLELETKEENTLTSMGAFQVNQSMKEALSRDVIILIVNNNKFQYKDPTFVMKAGEEILGEEVKDPQKLAEIRGKPGYMVSGSGFVIYTHKMRGRKGLKVQFITLPFNLPHDGLRNGSVKIEGVKDIVCGWPSRSVDLFIKQTFNIPTDDVRLGTLLVGFNLTKKS
jgi:hypothetical protein